MITESTGITTIETLYLQLMYRCQFRCAHCFHGERLKWREAYTPQQAMDLIELMHREYQTSAVNFLGGEPFLYTCLGELLAYAKRKLGMRTEICTNGYRITAKLAEVRRDLDFLRVSLEGLEAANDAIRHPGSFQEAVSALSAARELEVPAGVTMTVTATNIRDVVPLARHLHNLGVRELKLHHLRRVGYAAENPQLQIADAAAYRDLRAQLGAAHLPIAVLVDGQLTDRDEPADADYGGTAPRIESDPRGYLTMSCNAVGIDAHSFYFDKQNSRIERRPGARTEITLRVPPVVYADA